MQSQADFKTVSQLSSIGKDPLTYGNYPQTSTVPSVGILSYCEEIWTEKYKGKENKWAYEAVYMRTMTR